MKLSPMRKSRRSFLLGCSSALLLPRSSQAGCPGGMNPVVLENMKPGSYDWFLSRPARNLEIAGYASATSINRGGSINLHVHCVEPSYTVEVYRLGWYGSAGARLMAPAVTVPGRSQPMPKPDPITGLVECNWTNPYTLVTQKSLTDPTVWPSGYYLVKLTSKPSGYQSYIVFVVRDDDRVADHLFQQSVTTYAAYNMWGGKSLYGGSGGRAFQVSFNRPWDDAYGAGNTFTFEIHMLRFLEREGYDVKYCTNVDTHLNPPNRWGTQAFLSVGHDEYWSWDMRNNVEQARDRGINLAFFSANVCYWQIRFESSLITGAPNRTVSCYKDTTLDLFARKAETSSLATTYWRANPINRPEDSLVGMQYAENAYPASGDVVVSNASHWVFNNANVRNGTRLVNLLNGREVDSIQGHAPAGLITLCSSPVTVSGLPSDPKRLSQMTIYSWKASLSQVFASGTMSWSWGLDNFGQSVRYNVPVSSEAQQMTRNILRQFAKCPF